MSLLSLTKVQDYRKVPGKNEVRLVGEAPYLRFSNRDFPPIYLQSGNFCDESGTAVEIERWVVDAVIRVREDKLRKCGLDVEAFLKKYEVALGGPVKPVPTPRRVETSKTSRYTGDVKNSNAKEGD